MASATAVSTRAARLGVVAVVVAAVLFAVKGTDAEPAMQSGIRPTRLLGLRSPGTTLVLMPVAPLLTGRMRPYGHELAVMALIGVVAWRLCSCSAPWRSRGCRSGSRC